jgi:hypothetical protein
MKLLKVLYAFSLLIYGVSAADLTVSNTYFTSGAGVLEGLNLKNADYTESIYIEPGILVSEFAGQNDGDAPARVAHEVLIKGNQPLGAILNVDAKKLNYGGFFQAGSDNNVELNYIFDSGRAQAECHNQLASVRELVAADASKYQSTLASSSQELYLQGFGSSIGGEKSSFTGDMVLEKLGKLCRIDSYLSTGDDKSKSDLPVEYTLNSFADSSKNYADMGINLKVLEGNRAADFQLKGMSSELSDKYSPLNGKPAHFEPVDTTNPFYSLRVSKELDMKYEING